MPVARVASPFRWSLGLSCTSGPRPRRRLLPGALASYLADYGAGAGVIAHACMDKCTQGFQRVGTATASGKIVVWGRNSHGRRAMLKVVSVCDTPITVAELLPDGDFVVSSVPPRRPSHCFPVSIAERPPSRMLALSLIPDVG